METLTKSLKIETVMIVFAALIVTMLVGHVFSKSGLYVSKQQATKIILDAAKVDAFKRGFNDALGK